MNPHKLPLPLHLWYPWNQPAEQVAFTRSFNATQASPAQLYASCSGEYRAWLDGTALEIPASHLPSWRSMHRIDLRLEPGWHRLSIQAGSGQNQQPFWMACLDWVEGTQPARLVTDSSWRMLANPAEGWEAEPFEEPAGLAWRQAWAFDGVWAEPWGMPCNTPDDFCRLTTGWQSWSVERLAQVARLFPGAAALGAHAQAGPDGSFEIRPPRPYPVSLPKLDLKRPRLEWYRTREAHSLINNTWLDLFESRCPHLIFDAGAETFARVRVRLVAGGPAILALTSGESLNEVNRYARRVTDVFELRDGQTFVSAPTGFRYVKVMALSSGGGAARFDPLEVEHIRYPADALGQFRCSDTSLNAIFDLSVRTLHLCMQTEIWDGIKRDQLPWMGDLYTEALAAYLLFGEARLARRSLAVLAEIGPAPSAPLEQQRYPGLSAIWKTPGGDINDIPAYTLWWLVGVWEYWRYTGDLSLARELSAEIQATLEHIAAWVNPEGVWRMQSGWDFVDWAPLSAEDRAVYCHVLACRALRAGSDLLEATGQSGLRFRQLHERLAETARRAWGPETSGGFGSSHHANAQAICSGILSQAQEAAVFERSLRSDPALSMTYWHRYLDLSAAQQVGEIQWGLEYIRRHWGQALQVGMTSLWEAFDPGWIGDDPHAVSMVGAGYARYGGYETSLCHGWSSGPAIWLLSGVLGVAPAAPGFAQCNFQPNLGDLAWAEGSIPTPQGLIHIHLRGNPGSKPRADVQIPKGIELILLQTVRQAWEIQVTQPF